MAYVKSNSKQECINYIQAIVNQWEEITLKWEDSVLPCIDLQSIRDLQSRAPRFSSHDHQFIVNSFRSGKMLPKLTDDTLRAKVKTAICSQGPILTLQTFAQDILLLLSRVHKSMEPMVKNMKQKMDETLRKRICDSLESEFASLSSPNGLFVDTTILGNEFVERCYQHVFLHTIRNKITTKPIDRTLLSNLARGEFNRIYAKEGHLSVCTPTASEDAIITRAPEDADALRDVSGWEYVHVSKRHGSRLFEEEGATKLLYYDQVLTDPLPGAPITSSFMAMHIVRVFLFGAAANGGVQPQLVRDMLDRLPYCGSSPASSCAFDGSDSVSALPLYAARKSNLIEQSIPKFHCGSRIVAVSPEDVVRSKAPSLIDPGSSPVSPTSASEHTTKRPLPTSATYAPENSQIDPSTPVKRRRRLTPSTYDHESVSEPGSARSMDLVETRDSLSVTTTISPSIYSVKTQKSGCPFSWGTGREGTVPHNFGDEYVVYGNPFSDEMTTDEGQNSLNVGNHDGSRSPEAMIRKVTYNKLEKRADILYSRSDLFPKSAKVRYHVTRPEEPTFVKFTSYINQRVVRTVQRNEHLIDAFKRSQLGRYPRSTFMYEKQQMENGVSKTKEIQIENDNLYATIDNHNLKEVLVGYAQLVDP
jgi:hypothetical protein